MADIPTHKIDPGQLRLMIQGAHKSSKSGNDMAFTFVQRRLEAEWATVHGNTQQSMDSGAPSTQTPCGMTSLNNALAKNDPA